MKVVWHLFRYRGAMTASAGQSEKLLEGEIRAPSIDVAHLLLRRQGLSNLEITQLHITAPPQKIRHASQSVDGVTLTLQKFLALHDAGLPLVSALHASAQGLSARAGRIWVSIADAVQNGHSLATALLRWRKVLGQETVHLLCWGEAAGQLTQCVQHAIALRLRQKILQQRWQKLWIYPKMLALVMTLMLGVVLLWLMPSLAPLFDTMGAQLPWLTRVLIQLSNAMRDLAVEWISLGIVSFWIVWIVWRVALHRSFNSDADHNVLAQTRLHFGLNLGLNLEFILRLKSQVLMRLPFMGQIYFLSQCARWVYGLEILLRAGLTMREALWVVAQSMSDAQFQNMSQNIGQGLEKGQNWAPMVAQQLLLPPWLSALLTSSQDHDALLNVLPKMSAVLEQEIEHHKDLYVRYAEPIFLAVLGIFVLGLLSAIYLPLFSLGRIV